MACRGEWLVCRLWVGPGEEQPPERRDLREAGPEGRRGLREARPEERRGLGRGGA